MTLIFKQDYMPSVVQNVLIELGWLEHDETANAEDEWNIMWKPTR